MHLIDFYVRIGKHNVFTFNQPLRVMHVRHVRKVAGAKQGQKLTVTYTYITLFTVLRW